MRYALSILLALAASIANAADFALPVDASWSGATVTLVASRDGTQLGTGSGTIAQLAGGQYKASATIDLSAAGAGAVTVTAVDASGNLAAVGSGYQIDGAGALLDTTPLNSTETQAAAASALAAYDPPTNAEMEARTIVAANYATAANLATALSQTTASAIRSAVGLASANLDTQLSSIEAGAADTRDLEDVDHVWQLSRSPTTGSLQSTTGTTLYVTPGDTWRVAWNCKTQSVLPQGAVLATMTTPTSTNADFTITKLGIDAEKAKGQVVVAADATPGTYWITTSVTNNLGGGPKALYGKVVVRAAPDAE